MPSPPVTIEVADLPPEFHAGEKTPLTLVISRPAEHSGALPLRQVRFNRPDVFLDADLFQRDLDLHPGETYRVTVGLQARQPGVLRLADCQVQAGGDLYSPPDRTLAVRPSLRQEVRLDLEAICTYEQGTKVQLTLTHDGATSFHAATLRLGPEAALRAGKSVNALGTLKPGIARRFEAVVAGDRLAVTLSAVVDGQPVEVVRELAVPAVAPLAGARAFRFLEPRRMSVDQVDVRPLDRDDLPPVRPVQGVYPLQGKQYYRVVIRPGDPTATSVRLRELAEVVHVSPTGTRHMEGRWEFEVFLPANEAVTRPARVFYDVETAHGPLTGELHLAIQPPPLRSWKLAGALGAALTLQSATLLVSTLLGGDADWDRQLAPFNPLNGWQGLHFWYLLSIPALWAVLRLGDWVQYRWQT